MKATLALLFVLGTFRVADAGHRHCRETDAVVGYQQCSRFGARWASGVTLSWELGLSTVTMPFAAIDEPIAGAMHATAGAGIATATVGRLRNLYGLTPHFYVATELMFGTVTSAPAIIIGAAARETMPSVTTANGRIAGGMLAAGTRFTLGRVTLGTELAFGPKLMIVTTERAPGTLFGQGGPALEARAHGMLWLSPHWSAGVMLATSVISRGDYSLTAGIGFHAFPFDGGH